VILVAASNSTFKVRTTSTVTIDAMNVTVARQKPHSVSNSHLVDMDSTSGWRQEKDPCHRRRVES
jgi:hypothetical protein